MKSPARPNGTFGAFPAKRERTGFTFMVLVGLLLLSLALVAAWASFFLTQEARNTGTDLPSAIVTASEVEVEDEMAADLQDPEEFAAATEPATETAQPIPVNIGGEPSGDPPETSVAQALAESDTAISPATVPATAAELGGESAGEPPPASTIATDVAGSRIPVEDQDEIFLAAMDAAPPVLDALALPSLSALTDAPPPTPMPPPVFGTVYKFDAEGLLVPSPEGILSPDGIMLFAGAPPVLPLARSPLAETAAAEAAATVTAAASGTAPTPATDASLVTAGGPGTEALVDPAAPDTALPDSAQSDPAQSDPAMAGFRPRPRPEGLAAPVDDGASLAPASASDVVSLRPLARPASVAAAAAANTERTIADLGAQGASLTAQAEAQRAAAAALEAANPSIVAISMRPAARPSDLSRAVEAAVAAAVREPDPSPEPEVELAAAATGSEVIDEPEPQAVAPSIPTRASVAKQATYAKAINLKKVNLIGTFGTSSKPYALVRLTTGKYKKVKVGDKIDGGVVKAITQNEVRYQKGGKLVTLKMPKA